jgi:hypothetical protein
LSTETSRISQADAVNYVEGNRRTGGKSEPVSPVTVSETNSCCTTLSAQLGRAYGVRRSVYFAVCLTTKGGLQTHRRQSDGPIVPTKV